jgi:hypothetical protein
VFARSALSATFVVTTISDGGPGSLLEAVSSVNTAGVDRIEFSIPPLNNTVKTIVITNALPAMTNRVTIDGFTQDTNQSQILIELTSTMNQSFPGLVLNAGFNTVRGLSIHGFNPAISTGTNGFNFITRNYIGTDLTGQSDGGAYNTDGIVLNSANNHIAENLISANTASGVLFNGSRASNNTLVANFIGTDPSGIISVPNNRGVYLTGGASGNAIGTSAPGGLNVISGNSGDGILITESCRSNVVRNNLIGTDATGVYAIANGGAGVAVSGTANVIGDPALDLYDANVARRRLGPPRGNVISANMLNGITIGASLGPSAATNNLVTANLIGTDITGTDDIPNQGSGIGISQGNGTSIGRLDALGAPVAGLGNLICFNVGSGIHLGDPGNPVDGVLIAGNSIGAGGGGVLDQGNDAHGIAVLGARNSRIFGNIVAYNEWLGVAIRGFASSTNNYISDSIHHNGHIGIDLGVLNFFEGVTTNDNCDADSGSVNRSQNFPVITFVTNSAIGVRIDGYLNSTANSEFRLQFFHNFNCDPSGHGEGATLLGTTNLVTDGSCSNAFSVEFPSPYPLGCAFITATATDTNNNTSEFSQCYAVGEFGQCVTPPVGPVSWWPGGSRTNLAPGGDSISLSNGAVFVSGKVEQAFSFDGTNDFASVPDSLLVRPESFTLEAWVNFGNVSGIGRRLIMGKPVGSGFNNSYALLLENGALRGIIGNTVFVSQLITAFRPTTNLWYHLAYTYDRGSNSHAIFVNGVLQRRATTTTTNGYDNHPVMIGADSNNNFPGDFFAGLIDEPTIYDRALSAEELQRLFCAGGEGKCSVPLPPCALTCPGDVITNAAAGQCGAFVNFSLPETSGDCPPVEVGPVPGSFFAVGTNTVFVATNGELACTFRVIVLDTEPPVIQCPPNMVVTIPSSADGANVTFPPPVASDNCSVASATCNPPSGSGFNVGIHTVTCTARDASGNTVTCQFAIEVRRQTFAITQFRQETNYGFRLSWETLGGTTNVVQATTNLSVPFSDISSNIVIPGSNVVFTNYLDIGPWSNSPSRFYRIRRQ